MSANSICRRRLGAAWLAAIPLLLFSAVAVQRYRQRSLDEQLLRALEPETVRPALKYYSAEYYRWLAQAGARIQPLLRRGADPNARTSDTLAIYNRWGWLLRPIHYHLGPARRSDSALTLAIINREPSAARVLLDAGADVNSMSQLGRPALETDLFGTWDYGGLAAQLLQHGANPNVPDASGSTPLMH